MFNLRSIQRKIARSLKRWGVVRTLKRCLQEPYYAAREYRPSRIRWKKADREFDQQYGVETAGDIDLSALDIDNPNWEFGVRYQPTISPEYFRAVVGELPIRYEDFTFIDLGSGKGKALLLAAEFPFRRIVGVEFSKRLNEIARQNIQNFKKSLVKCAKIESVCEDAASYRLPDAPLVVYFFNPFQLEAIAKPSARRS